MRKNKIFLIALGVTFILGTSLALADEEDTLKWKGNFEFGYRYVDVDVEVDVDWDTGSGLSRGGLHVLLKPLRTSQHAQDVADRDVDEHGVVRCHISNLEHPHSSRSV